MSINRLFFAVRPDAQAAAEAFKLATQIRDGLTKKSRLVAQEHLHVTLHWLQDHPSVPVELVKAADAAASGLDVAAFEAVFDRVGSLRDAGATLTGGAGLAALRHLQKVLGAAMVDAGIGAYRRLDFRPHVSLLYADAYLPPREIQPIRWAVSELVLVNSLVGERHHIVLGRWPLRSSQSGFEGW